MILPVDAEFIFFTDRNEVVAKVIFLHLFVILFMGGYPTRHWGRPPWSRPPRTRHTTPHPDQTHTPPGPDTPAPRTRHTPPRTRYSTTTPSPPDQTPPGPGTPPKQTPAYGLRAAGTASYWNAFLLSHDRPYMANAS